MECTNSYARCTAAERHENPQWGRCTHTAQPSTQTQISCVFHTKAQYAYHSTVHLFIRHVFLRLHDSSAHGFYISKSPQHSFSSSESKSRSTVQHSTRIDTYNPDTIHATSAQFTLLGPSASRTIPNVLSTHHEITGE